MIKKIKNKINLLIFYVKENLKKIMFSKVIFLGGYSHSSNFGDALNVFFVEYLGEKRVVHARFLLFCKPVKVFYVIGSILQWAKSESIIWGSGFISKKEILISKNLEIFAVRGELSKMKLEKLVVNTTNISLGDPALLMPLIYNPTIKKKYKVGIIPHYVDHDNNWFNNLGVKDGSFKIIDILCGSNVKGFIDEVLSCDVIVSSSLHGLIIADTYNIPSVWVKFSNKLQGGNFKFYDYYSSIKEYNINPVIINETISLKDVLQKASLKSKNINLKPLIESCPFATEKRKKELISKLN